MAYPVSLHDRSIKGLRFKQSVTLAGHFVDTLPLLLSFSIVHLVEISGILAMAASLLRSHTILLCVATLRVSSSPSLSPKYEETHIKATAAPKEQGGMVYVAVKAVK
jgi:hypothetical protein